MKKIFSILVLLLTISLFGCLENKYVSNTGRIVLYMPESYSEHMLYDPPSFALTFDGTINTLDGINYSYYTSFTHNDDLVISELVSNLLEKYKDFSYTVIDETKIGSSTHLNRYIDGEYKKETVLIDNSERFYETTYFIDENGLMICLTYCRFSVEGKTIYRFRETKNIEMIVMYPLMVVKVGNENKFAITPLPFLVKNKVSASSTKNAQSIINSDDYVAYKDKDASSYYVYDYPEIENKKEFCIDFYKNYYDASISGDEGSFIYCGRWFDLHFYDDYFTIRPRDVK